MASPEYLYDVPPYKSRLQEYTQRACVQLPVYQTINEGPPHARQFKSQVLVDGIWYASPNVFPCRKMAEHDGAKHAFMGFREKLKAEGRSLILEDIRIYKTIINEYAVKMNMALPTYVTNESKAYLPIFVSSLQLNGITFTGDAAGTKKEAEQFAARSAILSILVSEPGTTMSEILKSKCKLYNALKQAKDSSSIHASFVKDSSNIQASTAMASSTILASTIMDSSSIQLSAVKDSSNIPAYVVEDSSSIPACVVEDSSSIPACVVKDSSITPACIVKASSSTLACNVKDTSSVPACIVKESSSIPVCIVKDSSNICLGAVATEAAPLDSGRISFTSAKEVDVGVSAIKDTLATIQHCSFSPFPSLQLALSESASEQPSRSQSTHQSLHVFKKPKPTSSVEAVAPPVVFVPPTIEQASESPPVCSTSGRKRRKNKKARKNVLYQSPSTIAMVPQNQVPAFSVTTQERGDAVSLRGFCCLKPRFVSSM